MITDIIFEQNYQKKVSGTVNRALSIGYSQGIHQVLLILARLQGAGQSITLDKVEEIIQKEFYKIDK